MIPVFRPYTDGKELEYLKEVIDSGWWGMGPKSKKFEKEFSEYIGIKYAVAVNSATSGLQLALKCIDSYDKEVITISMTFVSTNHAILFNGGIPVFCDIEPVNLNIDSEKIESLITDKTKAILVVHYGGRACEMDKILQIAKKYKLYVIEDCAHGCGGEYKGKKLGTIGDIGIFSFHAVKNLATGDGGMIISNNKEWHDRLKKLRWLGITKDTYTRGIGKYDWFYDVEEIGYKCHINDISAAIGLAQLEKLDWMNEQRKKWTDYYSEYLKDIGDIEIPKNFDHIKPSYHNYVIKTNHRDELQKYLKTYDIATGVHYYPNHLYDIYKPYYKKLEVTESIWKRIITLPLFPDLKKDEIDLIIEKIRTFFKDK